MESPRLIGGSFRVSATRLVQQGQLLSTFEAPRSVTILHTLINARGKAWRGLQLMASFDASSKLILYSFVLDISYLLFNI